MNELRFMSNMSSGDVAAWAAAICTFLLVAVGIGVPIWQSCEERAQEEGQTKDARAALRRSVFLAYRLIHIEIGQGVIFRSVSGNNEDRLNNYRAKLVRKAEAIVHQLDQVDFQSMLRTRTSEPLFRARAALKELQSHLPYWAWDANGIPSAEHASGNQFQNLKNELDYALAVFDDKTSIIIDALDQPERMHPIPGMQFGSPTPAQEEPSLGGRLDDKTKYSPATGHDQ